jgi:hypothetical protein
MDFKRVEIDEETFESHQPRKNMTPAPLNRAYGPDRKQTVNEYREQMLKMNMHNRRMMAKYDRVDSEW